jgi:hypothetical protein
MALGGQAEGFGEIGFVVHRIDCSTGGGRPLPRA